MTFILAVLYCICVCCSFRVTQLLYFHKDGQEYGNNPTYLDMFCVFFPFITWLGPIFLIAGLWKNDEVQEQQEKEIGKRITKFFNKFKIDPIKFFKPRNNEK